MKSKKAIKEKSFHTLWMCELGSDVIPFKDNKNYIEDIILKYKKIAVETCRSRGNATFVITDELNYDKIKMFIRKTTTLAVIHFNNNEDVDRKHKIIQDINFSFGINSIGNFPDNLNNLSIIQQY